MKSAVAGKPAMTGSQFARIELWTAGGTRRGDKYRWSAREVLSEMARAPGAYGHVERPEPPLRLLGVPPMEVADELDQIAAGLKDRRGRRVSRKARVLCAAVFSYPVPRAQADPQAERDWAADTLRFSLKFFGERNVRSAVAHTDEAHYHLHIAVVPPVRDGRMCWEEVHPGLAAEHGVRAVGGAKREGQKQFFNAMRSFQDRYFQDVAVRHGQSRTGPRRRRLTREEWHAERRVSQLIQKAAGRPMSDLLAAAHWQERYELAEKEKAAALDRAAAAEKQVEKLRNQAMRLLAWLRVYIKKRVRILRGVEPALTPQRERARERHRVIQRADRRIV